MPVSYFAVASAGDQAALAQIVCWFVLLLKNFKVPYLRNTGLNSNICSYPPAIGFYICDNIRADCVTFVKLGWDWGVDIYINNIATVSFHNRFLSRPGFKETPLQRLTRWSVSCNMDYISLITLVLSHIKHTISRCLKYTSSIIYHYNPLKL